MTPVIRGITFEPGGAAIVEYCDPDTDVKANGILLNHTLYISPGAGYDDEISEALAAVHALIADVREDVPYMEAARATLPTDDDDTDDDDDDGEDDDEDGGGEQDELKDTTDGRFRR